MNTSQNAAIELWERIKILLADEINPAEFENWISPTYGIEFREPTLIIGAANDCAKTRLEKLSSISEQIAHQISGNPIQIITIVSDPRNGVGSQDESVTTESRLTDQGDISVAPDFSSFYDSVVKPFSVIPIPAYFFRHIPSLGPDMAWTYLAFRQAAYMAGKKRNFNNEHIVRASSELIGRFSGCSKRTVLRRLNKPETWDLLSGFVTCKQGPKHAYGADGQPHQLSPVYRVSMTLPLTSVDAESLRSWIQTKLAGGLPLKEILEIALVTPCQELIPASLNYLQKNDPTKRIHVRDLIHSLAGKTDENIISQIEKLTTHLIQPENLAIITHFFIKTWLPKLSAGAAWMIVILRDQCFFRGNIKRDITKVYGGHSTIATWLGIKRTKTVWEWLREPNVKKFITELPPPENDPSSRRYQMNLLEPFPDDVIVPQNQFEYLSSMGADDAPGGANVTHRGGEHCNTGGGFVTDSWREWHPLNLLPPQARVKTQLGAPPPHKIGGGWDFEKIINRIASSPEITQKLSGFDHDQLVAWILYGFSPRAALIRDPIALAISRVLKGVPPIQEFFELSQLGPQKLQQYFAMACAWQEIGDYIWRATLYGITRERILQLTSLLGLNIPNCE